MKRAVLSILAILLAGPAAATDLIVFASAIDVPPLPINGGAGKVRFVASVTVADLSVADRPFPVQLKGKGFRYGGTGSGSCSFDFPLQVASCFASRRPFEGMLLQCTSVAGSTCNTGHSAEAEAQSLTAFNLVSSFCTVSALCLDDCDRPDIPDNP